MKSFKYSTPTTLSLFQTEILSSVRYIICSGVLLKKRHLDWGLGEVGVINNNKNGPIDSAERTLDKIGSAFEYII